MKTYKSIKSRIILYLLPGLIFILFLFGYFIHWAIEFGLRNHAEQILLIQANNLENRFLISKIDDLNKIDFILDSMQINNLISDAKITAIFNKKSNKIIQYSNLPEGVINSFIPLTHTTSLYQIGKPILNDPILLLYYPIGENWIILEHPIHVTFYGSRIVTYSMFFFLPAIALLIGFIIYYSLNKVLKPVSQAIQTAQSITTGDLQRRLKETGNDDEIDILIKTFNQMIERIDIGFKKLAQFTSNVAHELRTPITIIRGEIELALKSAHTPEEKNLFLSVLDEIKYLSKVIENLLLFSRLENENIELEKFELGLLEIIQKLKDRFKKLTIQKNIDIKIEANCNRTVFVDLALVKELFSILFDNAIKYSHENSTINITLYCEKDYCHVIFMDHCEGIPHGEEEKIFDRFYQINQIKSNPKSGSGLGLAIAKRIATLHGGKIFAENVDGTGCAFHVLIPIALYD